MIESPVTPADQKPLSIGDVAKLCDIPAHTLRYWEKEFSKYLSPSRTQGKQRRYTDGDIKMIIRIKRLLWTDRFSIEGAKRVLDGGIKLQDEEVDTMTVPHSFTTNDLAQDLAKVIRHYFQMAGSPA